MDRFSGTGYVTIGGVRQFVDLNLSTNTPGSFPNALWFNGIQESVLKVVEAAGLAPTDADNTQLLQALFALPGKNVQVFTTSGTFTAPANVTMVKVRVWAAGGCGGSSSSVGAPGGGGGGGGYAQGVYAVTPGSAYPVTVGAGTNTGSANGGSSSFSSFVSATGGHGGGAGSSGNVGTSGGGGTGTGGALNVAGSPGSSGIVFGGTNGEGGEGGTAFCGPGAIRAVGSLSSSFTGNAGPFPGGGSSGCTGSTATSGGGLVIVEW